MKAQKLLHDPSSQDGGPMIVIVSRHRESAAGPGIILSSAGGDITAAIP